MASEQVEIIMAQVQQLSPEDRLELVNRLTEWLDTNKESAERPSLVHGAYSSDARETTGLVYGKYRNTGRPESTDEDFRLAEWHPTEEELDGH
jgi:hypothetical protein